MWLRLVGRSGRPGVRDVRSASYAGAGYPKTLFSSHVRYLSLRSSAVARGAIAQGSGAELVVREAGRARAASPAATGCRVGLVGGGYLPAVAGEFAGDRDRDDAVGLFAGVFECSPAGVESALRAPGDADDLGRLIALAVLE